MSDLPEVTARRFVVSGRVQGVGFRAGTADMATRLGIEGWVRNLTDGRVEIHAQGAVRQVADFGSWLRQGPRWARVEGVAVSDVSVDQSLRSFEIRW